MLINPVILTKFRQTSACKPTYRTTFLFTNVFILLVFFACSNDSDALIASKIDTTPFDGDYKLLAESSFNYLREKLKNTNDEALRGNLEYLLRSQEEQYANFTIKKGIIRSGTRLVQEFSLTSASIEGDILKGKAVWHEDIYDPGDCQEVPIYLKLSGNLLEFAIGDTKEEIANPVVLERINL
jgi:hypothetical protein